MSGERAEAERAEETAGAICILANSGAGQSSGTELRAAAEAAGVELRVLAEGADIAAAARRAVEEGFSTIVAAGGDGTIAIVAGALAGTGATLGVLPLGTFNYVARGLGLPLDVAGAFEVIFKGRTRTFPVGEVNGRTFLNNASIGIYPRILQQREATYRRWGRSRLAAYWSTARTLFSFRRPGTLRVTVDGTTYRVRTPLVFIALSAYQLDAFGLEGADCIRDGGFAVLLAPECGRLGLMRFAVHLMGRSARRNRDFELLCGQQIEIQSRRAHQSLAYDGERERMRSPFHFRRRPEALKVRVPDSEPEG